MALPEVKLLAERSRYSQPAPAALIHMPAMVQVPVNVGVNCTFACEPTHPRKEDVTLVNAHAAEHAVFCVIEMVVLVVLLTHGY